MPGFPRPAPSRPAPFGGRAYFIVVTTVIAIFVGLQVAPVAHAESTLTEVVEAVKADTKVGEELHTELAAIKGSITSIQSSASGSLIELTNINKTSETSLVELKKIEGFTKTTEGSVKELDPKIEAISTAISSLGIEAKPIYTASPSSTPASTVDVADFSTGAQTDLSEMQQNVETVGWFIIGTILAMAVSWMAYMILRARR